MKQFNYLKQMLATLLLFVAAMPAFATNFNGTYTIGGTSPNYSSLSAAIADLNAGVVTGPTVFNIRAGSYSGSSWQGLIINPAGVSSTNTVTFQAESGPGTVTLSPTGSSVSNNFVFGLYNANYITIKDLTLSNTGTTYGTDVDFLGTSSYNTVINCILTGNTGTSTSNYKTRVNAYWASNSYSTAGFKGQNNKILNCSMPAGCSYVAYLYGDPSTRPSNFEISGCQLNPYYYGLYAYYVNDLKFNNNTMTRNSASTGQYMQFYLYDCDSSQEINGNTLTVSTAVSSSLYAMYRWYCDGSQSKRQSFSGNTCNYVNNSTGYWLYAYYNQWDSIEANTINFTTTSSTYGYNYYANNFSMKNNTLNIQSTSSGTIYMLYNYGYGYGNGHRIMNNTITGTSTSSASPLFLNYYLSNSIVSGNTVSLTSTNGSAYSYMFYMTNCAFTNNIINATGASTVYGLYAQANGSTYGGNIVANNKIVAKNTGSGTTYGLYYYYPNGDNVYNNAISAIQTNPSSTGTIYGLAVMYPYYSANFYNNTFNEQGSNSAYHISWYFYYAYNGAQVKFTNNIFNRANAGGSGYHMYIYDYPGTGWGGTDYLFDYNMFYTPTSYFAYSAYSGATASNYQTWRASTTPQLNRNGLFYPPAFNSGSTGDVTPNTASSDCWAMNGRGVHIAGNGTDVAGNPRALVTGSGAPDLGAYEFTPGTGVSAPFATPTPVAPAAGITQYYTLGFDTVASIAWDPAATVPATAPTVQQYSGAVAPSITTVNNTFMYIYTDILSASTANHKVNFYYKDPQMGTIGAEALLHLAQKDGSNPWVLHPFGVSGANAVLNYIYSPTTSYLTNWGSFTGADLANNAGATDIAAPTGSFCAGTFNTVVRIKNLGSNTINNIKLQYQINGGPVNTINYTTPISFNTGVPGSNEALISIGNLTFGAAPINIKAWTTLPNGVADTYAPDDTLNVNMRSALKGVYTVGGVSPDFNTPKDAVDALNTVGVCGAVTLNVRPGTYNNQNLKINAISGSSAANTVLMQSENGVASSVNITYTVTGSADNFVFNFNGASNFTLRNMSITAYTSNASYGSTITGVNASNDTVDGCIITAPSISSSYSSALYFNGAGTSANWVFRNNTISGGYYTVYWYGPSSYSQNITFDGNTVTTGSTGYMAFYLYYTYGLKLLNNTASLTGPYGYGLYNWYAYGSPQFVGNKFTNLPNAYYGMYIYYFQGISNSNRARFDNNVLLFSSPSASNTNNYYGLLLNYPSYCNITNNTIVDRGNYSGYYGTYLYTYSMYNDSIRNNIFATLSASTLNRYAYYWYDYPGYANWSDFNNIYTTSSSNFAYTYNGTHSSFDAYRSSWSSYGFDKNSISYDPGLNLTTGMPDPTNPNSWSVNGRGIQLPNNTKDIVSNPRPNTVAAGVPDLGAYEFTPNVDPPNCVVTPAIPAPGVTQTYKFGFNPVATVQWNTQLALTANVTVQQYSGATPPAGYPGFAVNKYPYFYTKMTPAGTGTTYDFNATVNYYDTWLGTITSEANMKMAEKVAGYPWISYNSANSISNVTANTLYAPGNISFGVYTGIDDGLNFSALIKVTGSTVLCSGSSVTLTADPTSGGSGTYTYQWSRNGTPITGATSSVYVATTGGDYTVTITGTGSQTATSVPVSITVVAPPMALITASGSLTYCTGNNLQLTASSGGTKYQWALNGVDIAGATNSTYNVTGAGTYTVKVSNIGCAVTSTATVVNAGPINVNLGPDVSGCEIKNQPYTLDAGYPGAKYLWSTGDTTQTISVGKGTGTYYVTVDAGPNCKGTDTVLTNILPLPYATGINYLRTGDDYTFTPAGAVGVNQYLWLFSDGSQSTASSVTKTVTGNLIVKLIIKNDCGSDTITMVNWATGVSNVANGEVSINVFPNPAKDVVNISMEGATMQEITVMNAIGEIVYRGDAEKNKSFDINVSSFASGRYMIRANTTAGIITKPFNVQR
ncbi:MAG: hypothetical protein JST82_10180 [Bacteroidetes bacterium]|nr:hypothetical protein [Bacteroidota bacterium]